MFKRDLKNLLPQYPRKGTIVRSKDEIKGFLKTYCTLKFNDPFLERKMISIFEIMMFEFNVDKDYIEQCMDGYIGKIGTWNNTRMFVSIFNLLSHILNYKKIPPVINMNSKILNHSINYIYKKIRSIEIIENKPMEETNILIDRSNIKRVKDSKVKDRYGQKEIDQELFLEILTLNETADIVRSTIETDTVEEYSDTEDVTERCIDSEAMKAMEENLKSVEVPISDEMTQSNRKKIYDEIMSIVDKDNVDKFYYDMELKEYLGDKLYNKYEYYPKPIEKVNDFYRNFKNRLAKQMKWGLSDKFEEYYYDILDKLKSGANTRKLTDREVRESMAKNVTYITKTFKKRVVRRRRVMKTIDQVKRDTLENLDDTLISIIRSEINREEAYKVFLNKNMSSLCRSMDSTNSFLKLDFKEYFDCINTFVIYYKMGYHTFHNLRPIYKKEVEEMSIGLPKIPLVPGCVAKFAKFKLIQMSQRVEVSDVRTVSISKREPMDKHIATCYKELMLCRNQYKKAKDQNLKVLLLQDYELGSIYHSIKSKGYFPKMNTGFTKSQRKYIVGCISYNDD